MALTLNSLLSRLHLKQLRLLVALDECGSLLAAARQVFLTQPGASKALGEIESAFGTQLFQRTSRGLVPTPVGRCVIRYARLIQTDVAHLLNDIASVMTGSGGRVSIGVIMGAVPLVTEAISAVISKHPDLSVEIVEDTSAVLLDLLNHGRLDMAVCRTSVAENPANYSSVNIREEKLTVIANTMHPLARRKRVKLVDLVDARWVVYRANMPMRLLLEREFHKAGLHFPSNLLETTSALATILLLQNNPSLVALVSTDVAQFCTQHGLTCMLPLSLTSVSEPYELVQRKGALLSPAAELFVKAFTQQ